MGVLRAFFMHSNEIKILAFVVAFKRYRKNSVIFKEAKYKIAQRFNLHPTTFNNYLSLAIKLGYIQENNAYKVIPFRDIVKDFKYKTDLIFWKHKILQSKEISFKRILIEIENIITFDNVIRRQQFRIKQKGKRIEAINYLKQTDKKSCPKLSYKYLKDIMKKGLNCVANNELIEKYSPTIRTSARNVSKHTSFSVSKSNKILNRSTNLYKREIVSKWFIGVSFFKLEELKVKYPKATIIPFTKHNKIKVCDGSMISVLNSSDIGMGVK